MAEKIKKTRPELLKQRRALAMFNRFLPTLTLKKQQIQMEILKVRGVQAKNRQKMHELIKSFESWVGLLSESLPGSAVDLIRAENVRRGEKNVAGIRLPILENVDCSVRPYSLFGVPAWVDKAVEPIKQIIRLRENLKVLKDQEKILQHELRKVTQRVNLFEKVMVPRAKENIRTIRISLAEEQTAGVGRAKIAKGKSAEAARQLKEARA